jgi:membrane protein DedA with SNARE-associated domain
VSIAHLPEITYPVLFLAVLAAQLCVPVPAILFLAGAGTLAALGKMNLLLIIAAATVGCLIGDYAWYLAGQRIGPRALRIFGIFSSDRRSLIRNTKQAFDRWGVYLFLIAKFIPGNDGILPPLAGTQRQPLFSFFLFDAAGSPLWAAAFAGIGFLFADRIEVIVDAMGHLSKSSSGPSHLRWLSIYPGDSSGSSA